MFSDELRGGGDRFLKKKSVSLSMFSDELFTFSSFSTYFQKMCNCRHHVYPMDNIGTL
jgi:hypothetical protein